MKLFNSCLKRITALILVFGLVTGFLPAPALEGFGAMVAYAQESEATYEVDNGYIKVTVSDKNGGFDIRTLEGDKVNKTDNNKFLLFEYDGENTSFASFSVTRGEKTKEYIFGESYYGSSDVRVTADGEKITAVWTVDQITFTQTITLVKSGSTEHGTALISYTAQNKGEDADIKCRMLMDSALGYQDYVYYRNGINTYEFE
ncbi:MAG: hypothetical protein IIV99_06205, partial [Oscillospiraceae bacterium]|nr:hypothetical protein [Oscillospiraceae bacterium]